MEGAGPIAPDRLAGRLRARLQYADIDEVQASGPTVFLGAILDECAAVHKSVYEAFVAYPLEQRLPA